MFKGQEIGVRGKILGLVLGVTFLSISLSLVISYVRSRNSLIHMATDQENSLRTVAQSRILDFFKRSQDFSLILGQDRLMEGLFLAYESAFYGAGYVIGQDQVLSAPAFQDLDRRYGPSVQRLLDAYGVGNILLININGQVVYSAQPHSYGHFGGASVTSGIYKGTRLEECFQSSMKADGKSVQFFDFKYYSQVQRTMSFFCIKSFAEFDHLSEGIKKGDVMGVVAVELNTVKLNSMLASREGQGDTGQIYLVGEDSILRSDFYRKKEELNINLSHKNLQVLTHPLLDSVLKNKKSGSEIVVDPTGDIVLSSFAPLDVFGKTWGVFAEKSMDEITQPVRTLLQFVLISSAFLFLFIGLGAVYLTNTLIRPLVRAASTLGQVTVSLSSNSQVLNQDSVTLDKAAKEQKEYVQATVAAVDQISSTINGNNTNAQESQRVSEESLNVAERGKEVIDKLMVSMQEIDQSNQDLLNVVEASNARFEQIVQLISNIGEKTKMINEIVFQTKLLSFNASVEAARAGDEGKGFAVVAEEVGNLANVSGASANEINSLLQTSIEQVNQIVRETKSSIESFAREGKEKVQFGVTTAHHTREVFDEILTNVNKVNQMVTEISSASQEQARGMVEINKAMFNLNQGTDNTAAIAGQSSSAAENLSQQAQTLNEVVQVLMESLHGEEKAVS